MGQENLRTSESPEDGRTWIDEKFMLLFSERGLCVEREDGLNAQHEPQSAYTWR